MCPCIIPAWNVVIDWLVLQGHCIHSCGSVTYLWDERWKCYMYSLRFFYAYWNWDTLFSQGRVHVIFRMHDNVLTSCSLTSIFLQAWSVFTKLQSVNTEYTSMLSYNSPIVILQSPVLSLGWISIEWNSVEHSTEQICCHLFICSWVEVYLCAYLNEWMYKQRGDNSALFI